MRLTVTHDGKAKVSIPSWTPYQAGEAFAISKKDWIKKQLAGKTIRIFRENDRIGKGHRLHFLLENRQNITSRVGASEIIVRLPSGVATDELKVQLVVTKAAIRALKQESGNLLPARLASLARHHGFEYRSVSVRHLKTRWGSCSSNKEIVLNCYLVQLPWDLIDYVIMHELLHTQIMAHGKLFWDELDRYVPNLKLKRTAIRLHHPAVIAAI